MQSDKKNHSSVIALKLHFVPIISIFQSDEFVTKCTNITIKELLSKEAGDFLESPAFIQSTTWRNLYL